MVAVVLAASVNYIAVIGFMVVQFGFLAILLLFLTPIGTALLTPVLWLAYGFGEVPAVVSYSWIVVAVPALTMGILSVVAGRE